LEKQYKYVSFKERLLYLDEEEVMSFMRYLFRHIQTYSDINLTLILVASNTFFANTSNHALIHLGSLIRSRVLLMRYQQLKRCT